MPKHAIVFVLFILNSALAEEFLDKPTTEILEGVPGNFQELRGDEVENTENGSELSPTIKLLPENDIIPEEYSAWNPETAAQNFIPYPYARPVPLNFLPVPPNRLQRTLRSDEDDLWDEVEQDAVMHNVLPIMPAPYFRSSQSVPPTVAFFPTAMGNCAVPILVSCSAQITRGTIGGSGRSVPVSFLVEKNK
ncbi:uncharacterized protein LOC121732120 [Aricia agestis]|uniref:uncharacterized protein LOC121732120 n=1 Tax=Aricia agestis TaxID=91739 RepID=UPI001C208070|nr:uncharacterized protein LOC121732120 [Aricia agestis]